VYLRQPRSIPVFALTAFLLASAASSAFAAGEKDKDALKLHNQAMDEDYLALELDKAQKKLNDALKKCGKDACSPEVVGKLHVALGTVLGAGLSKLDAAKDAFVKALQADPKATLNETFATDDLRKAFADAKAAAGGGEVASGDTEEEATEEEAPAAGGKAAGGDFPHTPTPEQTVNTPVPVYIEFPEDVDVASATLRYKPFGAKKWSSLEMTKMGEGYGIEIPCDAVTTTGDIKYYIIAKDASANPVGTAGTLKAPHKVPIKNEIEGAAPSLPGKKAPSQCAAKEDCPPGLPGCPDAKAGGPRGDKGWGASCESTQECQSGFQCLNGSCEEGAGGEDEPSGASSGKRKNLIALSGGLDMLIIKGGENVCSGGDDYACFYQNDSGSRSGQFYGNPAKGQGNSISGGFGIGGGRVLVSYDRLLLEKLNLGVGLRAGFAFGGSPSSDKGPPQKHDGYTQAKSFMPIHVEGRATYYLGGNTLEQKKVKPFVFVGGGLAQVNASVPVAVCDDADGDDQCDDEFNLNAYQITGLNFAGLGGGATYGLTDKFGIVAEVKVMFMVPTFGVVIAPSVGPALAF
jgi:hypothetical protein